MPMFSSRSPLGPVREFRDDRLGLLLKVARECGEIGTFRIFSSKLTLLNNPEWIRELIVEQSRSLMKSPGLGKLGRPLLGDGLLTSEGALWRRQRKLIAPTFQPGQIKGYAQCMGECTLRGIKTWKDGAILDISREMMRITLAIVGETLFGSDNFDEADEIGEAMTESLHWINGEMTNPLRVVQMELMTTFDNLQEKLPALLRGPASRLGDLLRSEALIPTERTRRFLHAKRLLDAKIQRMIDERRASASQRQDLLSRLLAARDEDDGGGMTDKQVRDEAMTLFLAGHETTANALTWALYLLSQHPEVLQKLKAEVDALESDAPGLADLPRLPYTLKVLKEAMRIYPPAYLFGRTVLEDVKVGPYRIPAGNIVIISPYVLHRRPDFWPAPQLFDPERFSPEAEMSRNRYTYLPFGGGPRICIGNHFAMMEGQIILATVVKHADLTLIPHQTITPEPLITLRPKGGIWMKVGLRGVGKGKEKEERGSLNPTS